MPEKCHLSMAALTPAFLFEIEQFLLEASWRCRLRSGVPIPEGLLHSHRQLSIGDTYPLPFPKSLSQSTSSAVLSSLLHKCHLRAAYFLYYCYKSHTAVPESSSLCTNLPATYKRTPLLYDLVHFSLTSLSVPVKIHVTQR